MARTSADRLAAAMSTQAVPRCSGGTILSHTYEQGLSARRWTIEEIFDPHLLDT